MQGARGVRWGPLQGSVVGGPVPVANTLHPGSYRTLSPESPRHRSASMKLLSTALSVVVLATGLAAQDQVGPVQPGVTSSQPMTPAGATGVAIPDISSHRVTPLSYVRRQEEIVDLDGLLDSIDWDADVLFTVGKRSFTQDDYRKRALMYLGGAEIEQTITRLITLAEIERRVAAGADRADFLPSDEDIDAKVADMKELIRINAQQQAGAEAEQGAVDEAADKAVEEFLTSIQTSMGMDKYRDMLGAEAAFEKVFLPFPAEPTGEEVWDLANGPVPEDDPKPEWLPQITWDAMAIDESGKTLRQFVKGSGARGDEIPAFFKGQILARIRAGIIQYLGADYFFDRNDLPADVFVRIGEHAVRDIEAKLAEGKASEDDLQAARAGVTDVTVDELWPLIASTVVRPDREIILREMLTLEGMQRVLENVGAWMGDDEVRESYAAHKAEYEGTLFPLTAIIMFRGYSSEDRYREHYRYRQAYKDWRGQTLTEEELEIHYREGGRLFFERGNAIVDMAYRGVSTLGYNADGFAQAESELMGAFSRIGATDDAGNPITFDSVMEQFPKPITQKTQGNDRAFQRNPLRIRMTESELSIFLAGYSMADDIYYHGLPGEIFGPYAETCRRHAWGAELNAGVWVAKLEGYARTRPLAPLEGTNLDQCREDFLDLNYLYWSQECLKALMPKLSVGG